MAQPSNSRQRTRRPVIAPAPKLPAAIAVSAGVHLDHQADGHPVVIEAMVLDAKGHPFVIPVRLTANLAVAIGNQLDRAGRNAGVTVAGRQQR